MNATLEDPFFQVARKTVQTSLGPVELPALYFDNSNLNALFRVPYEKVAAKLEGTGLVPGLTVGGKALVALSFYEYRQTTVGAYNEVGLAISVLPAECQNYINPWREMIIRIEARRLGYYILNLPVTTEIANVGGRELWGYPKFITDILFQLDERAFYGEVVDPHTQESIVTLSGRLGPGINAPPLDLVLYSYLGDQAIRSTVNVRGPVKLRSRGGLRLHVGDSDHPMARNLHELGMDGVQPMVVMDTHQFQSRLNEGIAIDLGVMPLPA